MKKQNRNKKLEIKSNSIENKFEIKFPLKTDLNRLYGMTLEQYKEGIEIHLKCFGQINDLKPRFW